MQMRMLEAMQPAATSGIDVSERNHIVELWADQLDHQHALGRSWKFGVLALPNKPLDINYGEISVELFCREADDWTKLTKSIRIGESSILARESPSFAKIFHQVVNRASPNLSTGELLSSLRDADHEAVAAPLPPLPFRQLFDPFEIFLKRRGIIWR